VQELSVLLQSPNLEGYLRPGCVHLTIDALLTVRCSAAPALAFGLLLALLGCHRRS
jgi:hypothetical protein